RADAAARARDLRRIWPRGRRYGPKLKVGRERVKSGLRAGGKGCVILPAGRLAQLVERLLYTQVAAGSSPAPPIRVCGRFGDLEQESDQARRARSRAHLHRGLPRRAGGAVGIRTYEGTEAAVSDPDT